MLLFANTRIMQSVERPVATGQTIDQEGQCLVIDNTSQVFGVMKSAATSGELFAGVSFSHMQTPLYLPRYETFVIGSGLTYTLYSAWVASTMRVFDVTGSAALTIVGGAPSSGQVQSTAGTTTLTFNSAQQGHTVNVSYRYSPTTVELNQVQGNIAPGGTPSLIINKVSCITEGDVYVTEFDTSVDWTAVNTVVKTGASGLFTVGGTGTTIPGGYIVHVPTSSEMYLGLHING